MVVRYLVVFLFLLLNFFAYAQHKPVKLLLHIEDVNGHPLTGMFSISVCDADIVPVDSGNAIGMSELLLCSEIKGRVENPNYYFNDNGPRRLTELDLLLMTQGWRRYDMQDILDRRMPVINNGIEVSQTVTGHVTATAKKQPRNLSLSLFNPQTFQRQTINLGDSSRFTLTGFDIMNGEGVTIEATRRSGSASFIQLHIDTIAFPRLDFTGDTLRHQDSRIRNYASQSLEQLKYENIYKTIDLPDVFVKSPKRYRNRKGIAARSLMAGDSKIERFTDVPSMLRWLGIQVRINDDGLPYFGKQSATFEGEPFTLTPTYVDDHKVEQEELWNIIPQDIEQVEYLMPNDASNIIYNSEAVTAGCLLVYLKDGKKNRRSRDDKLNVAYVTPLGYQPPSEFYNPKRSSSNDVAMQIPDLRTTLYWSPKVRTDNSGNAVIEFYNSDTSKRYLVAIEGIADDGTVVSNHTIIEE